MSCDPEWDYEVDVVCTDTGMAGLATAISTADADGTVFLAEPSVPHGGSLSWFSFEGDAATVEYLGELTADLDTATLRHDDADLPLRLAGEPVPARRRQLPPFEGWRLREWAARCIPSPTGYLYTQVTDWTSVMTDCGDGEFLRIAELGAVSPDHDAPVRGVREWLIGEARDRGVVPDPVARFERLVFDGGVVTGAVFSTGDGLISVRARHGVLVCRREAAIGDAFYRDMPSDAQLQVALVGREASRFGRVELLTSDPRIAELDRPAAQGAGVRASKS